MKRRILSILLALALLCPLLLQAIPSSSAESTYKAACGDDLYWQLSDEGVLHIEGFGPMADYDTAAEVPWAAQAADIEQIVFEGAITRIGANAFSGCTALTELTLPASVTSIGDSALYGCTALAELTLPAALTDIGARAFYNCGMLDRIAVSGVASGEKITLPDALCRIGASAMVGTLYYDTSANWKLGLLYADKWLVGSTADVIDAEIIAGTVGVADGALTGSPSLTTLKLPSSLLFFGQKALTGTALFDAKPNWDFGLLYIGKWLIAVNAEAEKANLRSNTVGVADGACDGCAELSVLTLPTGLRRIGIAAFRGCAALETVVLPDTVEYLGDEAFSGCTSLTDATLAGSFTVLGRAAFKDCASLGSMTIPDGFTAIGDEAFSGCAAMTAVTIPDSVTSIGALAFFECAALSALPAVSEYVESIGYGAFAGCRSLSAIEVDANNPYYLSSAEGILFGKDMLRLLQYPCGRALNSYAVPESVAVVAPYAFYGCAGPFTVAFAENTREIGRFAFYRSALAGTQEIPKNVMRIGEGAFAACESLVGFEVSPFNNWYASDREGVLFTQDRAVLVQVPASYHDTFSTLDPVTATVGPYALAGCTRLTDVNFLKNIAVIGRNACLGCNKLACARVANPACEIRGKDFTMGNPRAAKGGTANTVIYGYLPSTAKTYADRYNYLFNVLCAESAHSWDKGVPIVPATGCSEDHSGDGTMLFTCQSCGLTKTEPYALQHDWNYELSDKAWEITQPETCTLSGEEIRTCQRCGKTEPRVRPATGHTPGTPMKENLVEATCIAAGSYDEAVYCTTPGCGAEISRVTKAIPKLDHIDEDHDNFCDREYCKAPLLPNPFTDVTGSDWFYNAVIWAVSKKVTAGTTDTTFSPHKTCTRAEVVQFLYCMAGKPAVSAGVKIPFEDVSTDAWYYKAVRWAYSMSITGGIDTTHFGPNRTCTRGQIVTFLWVFVGRPNGHDANETAPLPDTGFNDVAGDAWYYEPVLWAVRNGVTSGVDEQHFAPFHGCTRAQVVQFLFKADKLK